MNEDKFLSKEQTFIMFFWITFGNIIYNYTWVAKFADRTFVVLFSFSFLVMALLILWIFKLISNNKGLTVFEIIKNSFGTFIYKIFLCLFIIISIVPAVVMLNIFASSINVFLLKNTPSWAIMLFSIIVSFIFAKSGIVSMAKLFQILAVIGFLNYVITFSFGFSDFKVDNIWPIFTVSVPDLSKGLLFSTGICSELVLPILIITESISKPTLYKKQAVSGLMLGASFQIIFVILLIGIINIELLKNMSFAGISVSRLIEIGHFIRGLEILVLASYQLVCLVNIAISLHCIKSAFLKVYNIKQPTIYLTIGVILIFGLSAFLNSYNLALFISVYYGLFVLLPFILIILLLSTIGLKKIKIKERRNNQ